VVQGSNLERKPVETPFLRLTRATGAGEKDWGAWGSQEKNRLRGGKRGLKSSEKKRTVSSQTLWDLTARTEGAGY